MIGWNASRACVLIEFLQAVTTGGILSSGGAQRHGWACAGQNATCWRAHVTARRHGLHQTAAVPPRNKESTLQLFGSVPRTASLASWFASVQGLMVSDGMTGEVSCPSCGHTNRPDRRHCTACGTKLAAACPRCGFPAEPGEQFCGGCGASLAAEPVRTEPAPVTAATPSALGGGRYHVR